jgi:hypothetical protein
VANPPVITPLPPELPPELLLLELPVLSVVSVPELSWLAEADWKCVRFNKSFVESITHSSISRIITVISGRLQLA